MAIGIDPVENHLALGLSDEAVRDMYRLMVLARRLDDRMWALNRQGRVPFVVSSSGHEGAQVGAALALDRAVDWSVPYYRDLAFMVALGMTPEELFLGLFAKEGDPSSSGRQMPSHWSLPRLRVFSHSSVIGTQFPHAAGIAFELKRTGRPGEEEPGRPADPLLPLTKYLEAEQKLGRVRDDVDCERAAFALFAIPFASVVLSRTPRDSAPTKDLDIMGAIEVVLEGILPRS